MDAPPLLLTIKLPLGGFDGSVVLSGNVNTSEIVTLILELNNIEPDDNMFTFAASIVVVRLLKVE